MSETMSEDNNSLSFWTLLKSKEVTIPIIQRDYAQGRKGKESLRNRFLSSLFDALQNRAEPLILDFIYGSTENDTFYPLDGQQRLTTLWLLHWYLALCADTLSEDNLILKKFSYETRKSSRVFCEKLCSIDYPNYDIKERIVSFIKNQNWYYSAYEQDPTIQSMLCMLKDIEKYYIEKIKNNKKEKSQELIKLLQGENSPIKFYLLNMEDKNMPLTDDLYIKMNARGKPLTDFENFKADLQKQECLTLENFQEESFSELMDTKWTDIFWIHRSKDYRIDEIYLTFFNRFFLIWYIISQEQTQEDITENDIYTFLSNEEDYQDIEKYQPVLNTECIKDLRTCLNNLYSIYENDKFQGSDNLFRPYWESCSVDEKNTKENFYFIARYNEENIPTTISLKHKVVFGAICIYLYKNQNLIINKNMEEWMHFVWNIVENISIDSEERSISAIRFFANGFNKLPMMNDTKKIDNPYINVIDYLSGVDESKVKTFAQRQLLEEIAKAKQINKDQKWKEKIYEAESFAFFKGSIAFLFNNEKGETDWSYFEKKFENAKLLFDSSGVIQDKLVDTLHTLYSYCNFFQCWWDAKIFNGKASTWKDNILTKYKNGTYFYATPVHHLLMGDSPSKDEKENRSMELLSNISLIRFIVNENKNNYDMHIRYPHNMLYYCNRKYGVMLDFEKRDKYLNQLLDSGKIELSNDSKRIDHVGLFWGKPEIKFIYHMQNTRNIYLEWDKDINKIYIMKNDWSDKISRNLPDNNLDYSEQYYCFNIDDISDDESLVESFCQQLENFIDENKL